VLLQLAAVHSVYRWRAADVELDAGLPFRLQPPMFPVIQFRPAIPTRGTKVPTSPDWIREIKFDGFRLIVHRAMAAASGY
jgi:ATP-dependent DNA ligase